MNSTWEETLLEALLVTDYRTGVDEAQAAGVTADDFLQSDCRALWRAMVELQNRGEPIQAMGLFDEMERAGMTTEYAKNVLARTFDGAPVGGRIPYLAGKVKQAAEERRFEKSVELANTRLAEGEDKKWVRDELLDDVNEFGASKVEARDRPLVEIVPGAVQALADRVNGDEKQQGLSTGVAKLDEKTTGINADELWIVGGMPGRGKTAFGLQTAVHLAGKGVPVYLISLEMSASAIFRRLLRMEFGAATVQYPSVSQWGKICKHAADLQTLPLVVNDSSSLDVREIVSRARLAIQRGGARLVIVDYLQLIRAQGKDRRESVGDACNQLRQLAKETHVPVMLMSQLRRPMNLNDRPSMIDLKESGDIEAHAHVVLLMYFPVDTDGRFEGREEIIIGKQREGPTGSIPVKFMGDKSVFEARYEF